MTEDIDLGSLTLKDIAMITADKRADIEEAEARFRKWMQMCSLIVPVLENHPHWTWGQAVDQLEKHQLLVPPQPVRRRLQRPEAE